ncbi:copper chaperone [Hymenobacter oligotrophus]|uniref:Copper chaperone n=1 Tax=Hymenobacter oligotrophus TaxID=2319843 RepID=A0A3B7RC06_9BACT|nr:heavy-metal-associated domain-containing protein [Hymenobacter oligotrophus]AYA36976.1 copper chaperone [Hymenobacter oligotrophus]
MKTFRALSFGLLAFVGTQFSQAQDTKPKAKQKAGTEQVTIKTSAVCDMCKARLEKSLAYEKGVQAAVLNVPTQMLTVTYRTDKTNADALRSAVVATGYDADTKTANAKAYERLPECCKKTNAVHSAN